jgi:alpha-ketoglutarate-dependent taurine dioxygenase
MIGRTILEVSSKEITDAIKDHKVLLVRNESEEKYLEAASKIGEIIPIYEDATTGNKTGGVFTDIRYDPKKSSSFSFSSTSQPFHTDGSYEKNAPDITFFFCRESAKYGGLTLFLDNEILIDLIPPSLMKDLMSIPVRHTKGNDEKTRPILVHKEKLSWNWNFFRAEKNKKNQSMIDEWKNLLDHVEQSQISDGVKLHPGDAVFFWDEDQLHGRNAFFGNRWLVKGGIKCPTETL